MYSEILDPALPSLSTAFLLDQSHCKAEKGREENATLRLAIAIKPNKTRNGGSVDRFFIPSDEPPSWLCMGRLLITYLYRILRAIIVKLPLP